MQLVNDVLQLLHHHFYMNRKLLRFLVVRVVSKSKQQLKLWFQLEKVLKQEGAESVGENGGNILPALLNETDLVLGEIVVENIGVPCEVGSHSLCNHAVELLPALFNTRSKLLFKSCL